MNNNIEISGDFLKELRLLNSEVDRAAHSWIIFEESVRHFKEEQQDLVDAINAADLGRTFNHIQMILLHDCVSTIYRIIEGKKRDCINVDFIVRELGAKLHSTQSQQIAEINKKRKYLKKSIDLENLRTFRNNNLGHLLRGETPPTDYAPIPVIIAQLADILEDCFFVLGSPRWVGQQTQECNANRAASFWRRVEIGTPVANIHANNIEKTK